MSLLSSLNLPRWTLWSWRHKTLFVSCITTVGALILVAGVLTLWQWERAPFRAWLSLTFVPFIFVIVLGLIARIQQRFDLRAGRNATLPPSLAGEEKGR